jgi:hypothetical protein
MTVGRMCGGGSGRDVRKSHRKQRTVLSCDAM